MPIYPYSCPKCLKETEILKSSKDYDRAEFCEACSTQLERMMPQTAPPKFVGPGFYATDYKRRGK